MTKIEVTKVPGGWFRGEPQPIVSRSPSLVPKQSPSLVPSLEARSPSPIGRSRHACEVLKERESTGAANAAWQRVGFLAL